MNRRRGGWLGHPLVVLLVVLVILPFATSLVGSTTGLATQVVIYTLYAIAFNLMLGYTGLVSFGASLFFGTGTYLAALTALHVAQSVFLGVVVAIVLTALLSVVLGLLILRRRGIYFALLTLAFTQLFYEIAFHWTSVTGGENGLQGVERSEFASADAFYAFVAVVVFVSAALLLRIAHSPFGRVLQVIRDNERRAQCLGYDPWRYKLGVFVISSTFIGLAGALLAFLFHGAYADNLNWLHAGDPVLMTVLGGMHHFLGPLWGALIFINLQDQLSAVTEHWWIFFGALLIAVVLLSPEGVSGIVSRLRGHRRWALTLTPIPPPPAEFPELYAGQRGLRGEQSGLPDGQGSVPGVGEEQRGVGGASRGVGARHQDGGAEAVVLEARGLCKRFGAVVTADDVNVRVLEGRIHSLIGPNGAGKTTFFNMLTGLLSPDAGSIALNGRDITALPVHERFALGMSRSFQIVSVPLNLSVFEAVRVAAQSRAPGRASLWRNAYDLEGVCDKTWALLRMVGLEDRASETAANLPHGELRLLDIGVALAGEPEVLLLDEPLAGLADADRERIAALLERLAGQYTIVLIEHDIDRVVTLSDHITVLHQGRVIADGPPQEVVNNREVVEAYLGKGAATAPAIEAASEALTEEVSAPSASPVPSTALPTAELASAEVLARTTETASETAAAGERASARSSRPVILRLRGVAAGYSGSQVLNDLDMEIREGETVALLGRNGVGKTTTLHTIMGAVRTAAGSIEFAGHEVAHLPSHRVSQLGISIVPQGRRIFPNLTVVDNLLIARRPGGWELDAVYELFPKLRVLSGSLGDNLSGGELQMLAIARALMAPTRLLLLDEPFEGLAPVIVDEVRRAVSTLRGRTSILLVEQRVELALQMVDRVYVMVNGHIAYAGAPAELLADKAQQVRLLGV